MRSQAVCSSRLFVDFGDIGGVEEGCLDDGQPCDRSSEKVTDCIRPETASNAPPSKWLDQIKVVLSEGHQFSRTKKTIRVLAVISFPSLN